MPEIDLSGYKTGGDFPPSWSPEKPETLQGVATDFRQGEGDYGPWFAYDILADKGQTITISTRNKNDEWETSTVTTDGDLTVSVKASRSGLKNALAKINPQIGDKIKIDFLGKLKGERAFRYEAEMVAKEEIF